MTTVLPVQDGRLFPVYSRGGERLLLSHLLIRTLHEGLVALGPQEESNLLSGHHHLSAQSTLVGTYRVVLSPWPGRHSLNLPQAQLQELGANSGIPFNQHGFKAFPRQAQTLLVLLGIRPQVKQGLLTLVGLTSQEVGDESRTSVKTKALHTPKC